MLVTGSVVDNICNVLLAELAGSPKRCTGLVSPKQIVSPGFEIHKLLFKFHECGTLHRVSSDFTRRLPAVLLVESAREGLIFDNPSSATFSKHIDDKGVGLRATISTFW
jgi:hypothetical protein